MRGVFLGSSILLAFAGAAPTGADYDATPFPSAPVRLNASQWTGHFPDGRPYNASLATFDPRKLSIALSPNGCVDHAPVSATAKYAGCAYAVNGGFFDFPPKAACEGNLVIGGGVRQFPSDALTNIAVNGTHALAGYLTNGSMALSLGVSSLVSGRGWLVRGGKQYVNASREWPGGPNDPFVRELAPRTGVGVRGDGTGMLLTIDGIEGTSLAAGCSLWEFANLFLDLGAIQAVNMDGGGSTTAVYNGKVFNKPHCADTWTVCERAVTSVACVAA